MLTRLLRSRVLKFLLSGGAAVVFNIILIVGLIQGLGLETPLLRNLANIIAIELSLIASFLIYRLWVWPGGEWSLREVFFRQLPLYHLATGLALVSRILVLFPLLDWLNVHYAINTLVGGLVSATFNYVISDRLVFNKPKALARGQQRSRLTADMYYPEGLAPALEVAIVPPRPVDVGPLQDVKRFSIVIPAYNEEESITATIHSITASLESEGIDYEILVVNDNSRDRTEHVLQELKNQNPRIRYINNYYPNGFGFAVRCGLENFSGDAVAIVMADSSDLPSNIVDYYYKLQEGFDCVFGSRFIRGGAVIDYPIHKLVVNRLANLFIQVLFGLKFNDTTNAFKAYRRDVITGISPLLSHHFNLTVEIPLKSIVRGYSYAIIPITWQNRTSGVSKLKLKEMGSRYLFIVLSVWLEKHLSRGDYVRQRREHQQGSAHE